MSICRRSFEFSIPQTSLHRILNKDVSLKAYKVQLTQQLKPSSMQDFKDGIRKAFGTWAAN